VRPLDEVISTGRGGAGNIRSPSRDAIRGDAASINSSPSPSRAERRGRGYDRDAISAIDTANDTGVHSTGRGGFGNITRPDSVSRSRSREPGLHSTGRGGVGNLYTGDPIDRQILEVEESERAAHQHPPGVYVRFPPIRHAKTIDNDNDNVYLFNRHSTGRGGAANLTPGEVPYIEVPVDPHGANHPHATHNHDYESTGRGGVGNIERSRSREPRDPNSKDHGSGLTEFLQRVTHPGTQKDGVQGGEGRAVNV
jgi:hypothetical protein